MHAEFNNETTGNVVTVHVIAFICLIYYVTLKCYISDTQTI